MSRTLFSSPYTHFFGLKVLDDLRYEIKEALLNCSDISVLKELECNIDDGGEFALILDLPNEAERMIALHDTHQSLIQGMLVDLLKSHTIERVFSKSFFNEYNSLSLSDRSELHGLQIGRAHV